MGPALPLGQESRHELFDIDVDASLDQAMLDAVNSRLPSGLRFLAWELFEGDAFPRKVGDRGRVPFHVS